MIMQKTIHEGKAVINAYVEDKVSKELPVFYNPVMEFNRTSSVLLLNALGKKDMNLGMPLEGSGIRSVRFLLELDKGIIEKIHINDYSEKAIESAKENLELNNIPYKRSKKIFIHNKDANLFILESTGFDYIDIDPFGSPNPFLDSAVKRISREGIIAITATDTAPLSGTYPKACQRKYFALPLKTEIMHEFGLRILIRKVQLIAAQYEKALMPILSFSRDHYMRCYLRCIKGKEAVDDIISQHKIYKDSGPIWTGKLNDTDILNKLKTKGPFYNTLYEESKIETIGFFSIPRLCKAYKINPSPKKQDIIAKVKSLKYRCSETHFEPQCIRTDMPEDKFVAMLKTLVPKT